MACSRELGMAFNFGQPYSVLFHVSYRANTRAVRSHVDKRVLWPTSSVIKVVKLPEPERAIRAWCLVNGANG